MDWFTEYKRVYKNYDKCLECLLHIMEIATEKKDSQIAGLIANLLVTLEDNNAKKTV